MILIKHGTRYVKPWSDKEFTCNFCEAVYRLTDDDDFKPCYNSGNHVCGYGVKCPNCQRINLFPK